MIKECPFCYTRLNKSGIGQHIYFCSCIKNINISKNDIRYIYLLYNYGLFVRKDTIEYLYINKEFSLPEFRNEFGIGYKTIIFLLDYFNIPKRSHKIVMNSRKCLSKREVTNIERYEAINPLSKGTSPYKKRNETVKSKYGVCNIFQTDEVKEKSLKTQTANAKKIGLSYSEYRSKIRSNTWGKLSEEEKTKWLNNSIHSIKNIKNFRRKGIIVSKLEKDFAILLDDFNKISNNILLYSTQVILYKLYNDKIKRVFCDFKIDEIPVIIEIYGDLYHANPHLYKKDDIIACVNKKASAIWSKDKKREAFIKGFGYKLIIIWESEIKTKTHKQLLYYLLTKIVEVMNENN